MKVDITSPQCKADPFPFYVRVARPIPQIPQTSP